MNEGCRTRGLGRSLCTSLAGGVEAMRGEGQQGRVQPQTFRPQPISEFLISFQERPKKAADAKTLQPLDHRTNPF